MRVFITGATGLLGSHLASLLRGEGHDVVALVRGSSDATSLRAQGCELFDGDVGDRIDVLAGAMTDCTHVVHAAALVYSGTEWPKVRAVNVDGTRNVLTAASRAGVRHALHVSSVAVYGQARGAIDEKTPTNTAIPPGDLYARSKREAEVVALEVENDSGLPVTVVRPSAVYGEHDRLVAPALANILRLPLVPVLGKGDNTLPIVYAGNVANAMAQILKAERGKTTFDLGMDFPLTQRELLTGLAAGLGRTPHLFSVPAGLVRGGARVAARIGSVVPGTGHLPVERIARLGLGQNPYASTLIRSELSWSPPYVHAEALARTGRWLAEPN